LNYKYLEDIATADVAFEAWGETREEMFTAAADATMNTMVDNLSALKLEHDIKLELVNDDLDMLLFDFLNEFLFHKDSQLLLLRVKGISIQARNSSYKLNAVLSGEKLDAERHHPAVDVKAVTMHKFGIEHNDAGWKATVVLDI
jgi:SHS2 domain-containing protein